MRRSVVYAALVLVSFLVAFVPAYRYAHEKYHEAVELMSQSAVLSQYETLAFLQYKHADSAHGRAALLDLVIFLDQVERNRAQVMQKTIEFDRALTYARLALLEQTAGNDKVASEYVRQVQESIRRRDGKAISEDAARKFVNRVAALDSKNAGAPFI